MKSLENVRSSKSFAKIFNYYIYNGKNVIEPDSLTELDVSDIVDTNDCMPIVMYTDDRAKYLLFVATSSALLTYEMLLKCQQAILDIYKADEEYNRMLPIVPLIVALNFERTPKSLSMLGMLDTIKCDSKLLNKLSWYDIPIVVYSSITK